MKERIIIYADEGKILTNGEIYGKQIFLAENIDKQSFYEVSEEEYLSLMDQKNENI